MQQYLDTLELILNNGNQKNDRTGIGTISYFGIQNRYNLQDEFPIITTKKMWFKGIVVELLWFLKGSTNIGYLLENGVNIWNGNAYDYYVKLSKEQNSEFLNQEQFIQAIKDKKSSNLYNYNYGDLGDVYGKQWRNWNYKVDQIADVIKSIKNNPNSRRHLISAWNVDRINLMALPPCHYAFQFYVNNNELSCMANMRSNDQFLGSPYNISSYALLTYMIAQVCNLQPKDLIMSIGDAHIYNNHIQQVKEQLQRKPMKLPKLWLNPDIKNIDDFKLEDIKLIDYNSHPSIRGEMAV